MARADRSADILATTGVHIGGTDFDRKLNLSRDAAARPGPHRPAGPRGAQPGVHGARDLAPDQLPVHAAVLAQVQGLRVNYSDTKLHDRLMAVLKLRLGHRLASEVEQAKILCSQTGGQALIDLDEVERGLQATLDAPATWAGAWPLLDQVVACAHECVKARAWRSGDLDAIYLTGGSSALQALAAPRCASRLPGRALVEGDLFGGVAAGLAYAARTERSGMMKYLAGYPAIAAGPGPPADRRGQAGGAAGQRYPRRRTTSRPTARSTTT
jgi:hypothetical chaperone protein